MSTYKIHHLYFDVFNTFEHWFQHSLEDKNDLATIILGWWVRNESLFFYCSPMRPITTQKHVFRKPWDMGINLSFQSSTMDHSWFDVVRLHRLKENRMVPCHDVQNLFGCVAIFSLEEQRSWEENHWSNLKIYEWIIGKLVFSGKNSDSWLENPVLWMVFARKYC